MQMPSIVLFSVSLTSTSFFLSRELSKIISKPNPTTKQQNKIMRKNYTLNTDNHFQYQIPCSDSPRFIEIANINTAHKWNPKQLHAEYRYQYQPAELY
jgi:hypothetical protein